MSRWADDPEGAADALILGSLDDIGIGGRLLVVNQGAAPPACLKAHGLAFGLWNPPRSGSASLILAPARALRRCAGAPAQGPRRAGDDPRCDARRPCRGRPSHPLRRQRRRHPLRREDAGTALRRHRNDGRARARPDAGGAEPAADGRTEGRSRPLAQVSRLAIAGATREWVSYPRTFAAGRLDEGTALLLSAMPPLPPGARVLNTGAARVGSPPAGWRCSRNSRRRPRQRRGGAGGRARERAHGPPRPQHADRRRGPQGLRRHSLQPAAASGHRRRPRHGRTGW